MPNLIKLSLITVVYNAAPTITACLASVLAQSYSNIEYIVMDGGSTDGTLDILKAHQSQITILRSERDLGMYDALNKGIALATGEVIGILHADDMLASADILAKVMYAFEVNSVSAVYGNLNYVNRLNPGQIIRKWRSNTALAKDLAFGWMPAHPTLYLKKEVFENFGSYSLDYGSAADYEFILRIFYKYQISSVFLDELIVNMRVGGISNQSTRHRYQALRNDYLALIVNDIPAPLLALTLKKLRKIKQFF